ncbi:hypothetical protein A6R68_06489 [Neotoma lepida]|uniref:Uncharacterized protein n=1 Tax=Neotoma lepida TaxID=56216 RepID=A0A1A6GFG3_NEOLE|nr:hypothetical protein A6R68_06489 [Neotoma lepida]
MARQNDDFLFSALKGIHCGHLHSFNIGMANVHSTDRPRPRGGVTYDVTTEAAARTHPAVPSGAEKERVARRMTRIYADSKARETASVEEGAVADRGFGDVDGNGN